MTSINRDYNSNYLFSNSSNSFFNNFSGSTGSGMGLSGLLGDYASIKNGSYGKLLKAYYAKSDAETAGTDSKTVKKTNTKLTLTRASADDLESSAKALMDGKVYEQNNRAAGVDKVKAFIEDYNAVLSAAAEVDDRSVLRNGAWMTNITKANSKLLEDAGITIGKGNKLELDEDVFKKAGKYVLNTLFSGHNSYLNKIMAKAGQISRAAGSAMGNNNSNLYNERGIASSLVNTGALYDEKE